MIPRRTKIQLLVFALITLLGVSFVGAKYAQLDRLFYPTSYTVVAHFQDSGGMYAGGMVAYRGVRVGEVDQLVLTHDGVDAYLDIDNELGRQDPGRHPRGGRQPLGRRRAVRRPPAADRRTAPTCTTARRSRMADTRIPLPDPEAARRPVDDRAVGATSGSLRTTVHDLGQAFAGTGPDLQRIIDTGTSFIRTANRNFDVTTALIRDGNTVLQRPDRLRRAPSAPSPATCGSSPGPWPVTTATCAA